MLTVEKKKKYTAEDYMMLEEGAPFQLINYDLVIAPSPLPEHQIISVRLAQKISNFLDEEGNEGLLLCAPMDVKFDEGNILQPDILFITAQRRSDLLKERIEGAPDLVIEILSPSNAYYDLRQKKDIYEKYGVKEYIIVDPVAKDADLYALKDGVYYLHQKANENQTLNSLILAGFGINLAKLFK